MTHVNLDVRRAWMRARMTKLRLEADIAKGKPAIRIAELSERLERQRSEYYALRDAHRKI